MKIKSEQEMVEHGKKLAEKCKSRQDFAAVIELIGDVGVGKTTLVRGLAEELGVMESVTSPSFTISKAYALPSGGRLVHYDFYRLDDPGLMVEDLQENLAEAKNVVVIEWGESVADLLPEWHLKVEIGYNDDGTREVVDG
ncbi:tRNA (adenosine(37)-N6)-threonylcarbamoyltransferase complex ATPase subunit type 1 TsaE [Candidatus Saccharibacteria bacterium]|nr:tRNA (adenosine(37)-N6)-threonylcarbamoyltransferase complex ATPase subunit type 1 TsaE [Candidatus Saccharibacteria bacterium]